MDSAFLPRGMGIPISAPLPAGLFCLPRSLGRHKGQCSRLFHLSGCGGHRIPTCGVPLPTSMPTPVLVCSQGHLISPSCGIRNGRAAAGSVAARRESRWQGHHSALAWMQSPGPGPRPSRKGRQGLGWPKGSAESQASFPQLLLRAGTKAEQPCQVGGP